MTENINLYNPATDSYDRSTELSAWAVNWIISGSKVVEGYDPFGRLAERVKRTKEAIARADKLIAELDPFDPCQPPAPEFEMDDIEDWRLETEALRRGEG